MQLDRRNASEVTTRLIFPSNPSKARQPQMIRARLSRVRPAPPAPHVYGLHQARAIAQSGRTLRRIAISIAVLAPDLP
jgi:hypothetical protein